MCLKMVGTPTQSKRPVSRFYGGMWTSFVVVVVVIAVVIRFKTRNMFNKNACMAPSTDEIATKLVFSPIHSQKSAYHTIVMYKFPDCLYD